MSTIADTWLHVSYVARGGERNRALTISKSRRTGHSNRVRELIIGPSGIDAIEVYIVLMGELTDQLQAQRALHALLHLELRPD